ncbi:NAC domain-containing protein 60-like [Juglans microcarpa x Juglans regia]|uniref:NAC domain-containing protein 60-like n=1 Tax=Juglans microcarpa x Juglans regia TaxID=2249226 RepID=UPI001B7F06B7|nr:NAC domain-containing protein 60-like [Juglans microcarpa x Juglans regia]
MEGPSGDSEKEGPSMEAQMSLAASTTFPGFRFSPTDEELISYYLQKKLEGSEKCVEVISEVEICRYEPWDLPAKSVIQSDNEWFFFSARGRKYPNGSQSRRATELGYWKATGKERNVKSGSIVIGTKRTLVFHTGRAPKGERTEWIMHEYCMTGISQDSFVVCRLRKNLEFRPTDSTNQASSTQRNSLDLPCAVADVGIEQSGLSEGDKAVGSSHDSYSLDQIDSTSESDQKLTNEVTMAESSSQQKEIGIEEDFYAEILKDDIIKLDESSLSFSPLFLPTVTDHVSEAERETQQPIQETTSWVPPLQGTANRRIKLRLKEAKEFAAEGPESRESGETVYNYLVEKDEHPNQEQQPPKCLLGIFYPRTINHWRAYVLFIILTVLALFLSWLGGSRQARRITYATLYEHFWQRM